METANHSYSANAKIALIGYLHDASSMPHHVILALCYIYSGPQCILLLYVAGKQRVLPHHQRTAGERERGREGAEKSAEIGRKKLPRSFGCSGRAAGFITDVARVSGTLGYWGLLGEFVRMLNGALGASDFRQCQPTAIVTDFLIICSEDASGHNI